MNADLHPLDHVPAARTLAELQSQMQRPAVNANLDGGFELGWGTMVLCAGLSPYFVAALPYSVTSSWWKSWVCYLPLLVMAFGPYAVPKLIKRYITWPRTGYVADPNEVKLSQLLLLMAFGAALGFALVLPFLLFSDIRGLTSPSPRPDGLSTAIWHGVELLVCASLVVFLGRKTIRKRQPIPGAYDAAIINQGLGQTAAGRKTLRVVRLTLVLMFVGLPIVVGLAALGLLYLTKSALHHAELSWTQLGVLSFFVGCNAILYLMGNAAIIRQHRWKWLALATMLIGSAIVALTMPYKAARPELAPMLELFPPPVMLFLGLLWFLSGATTLLEFLRHHPRLAAESV